jgi:hypothetical protein
MSESFDPYHKWLGIPPPQQPPNHYRLLGITEFESDPDVIDSAANQRMAYLHDLSAGEHIADSQRLLNEVAAARHLLLDNEKRTAYDTQLKAAIAPPTPTAKPLAIPLWAWIAAGVVTASIITGIVYLIAGGSSNDSNGTAGKKATGTLVLKWKLSEREGAILEIDGKEKTLKETESLEFELEVGNHTLRLQRDGFGTIRNSVKIDQSKRHVLRLNWLKAHD